VPAPVAQAIFKKQFFWRTESSGTTPPGRITEPRRQAGAIGVLRTGIDACYRKENKKLYEKVLERGAIISDCATGSHASPQNFPVRNRIIAGMPLGVIIVEGKQYSGSLITARLTMEFGREVFGVPGNVTQDVSFAPNQLIKQEARLVANAEDVMEELPTLVRAALLQAQPMELQQRNLLVAEGLTETQKMIYDLPSVDEPKAIDEIVEASELNSSVVLATLFEMEVQGVREAVAWETVCESIVVNVGLSRSTPRQMHPNAQPQHQDADGTAGSKR
jgi:DNA processing protein